jgi:mycothiol synthase
MTSADGIRPAIGGLVVRPFRPGDGHALAMLGNADREADGIPVRTTGEQVENAFARPTSEFDALRDALLLELDGKIVGSSTLHSVETTDGSREFRISCAILPEVRRRGIGRWLLRMNEEMAVARLRERPTEGPALTGTWCPDQRVGQRTLMVQEGYQPARYFFEMERQTLDSIDQPPIPAGIEVRSLRQDQVRQLWTAQGEAFADHWGGFDGSDASYESWRNGPLFDSEMVVAAWDGEELAGAVTNEINDAENEALGRRRGRLEGVFVRVPWRRRGLARALVMRSLAMLRDRGMTSAGLNVDAENATEALRLYLGAGFGVESRAVAYRKPLVIDR